MGDVVLNLMADIRRGFISGTAVPEAVAFAVMDLMSFSGSPNTAKLLKSPVMAMVVGSLLVVAAPTYWKPLSEKCTVTF